MHGLDTSNVSNVSCRDVTSQVEVGLILSSCARFAGACVGDLVRNRVRCSNVVGWIPIALSQLLRSSAISAQATLHRRYATSFIIVLTTGHFYHTNCWGEMSPPASVADLEGVEPTPPVPPWATN